MHAERVERQHTGGLGEQTAAIRRDHGDRVGERRLPRHHLDVHPAVPGQGKVFGWYGFGLRLGFTGHRRTTPPNQVPDQGGLPVAPDAGSGSQRVGLGESVQQLQQHRIAAESIDHRADGGRVLKVTAGGRRGQQQMVAHHGGQQPDVGRPQPEALAHLNGEFGTDHTVVTTAALADIVQQSTKHQQIRARHPGGESACPRDGFDKVTVYRPGVHLIPRRQVADRAPLREEPAPQTGPVQGLDGGHCRRSRGQQHQQVIKGIARPRCA